MKTLILKLGLFKVMKIIKAQSLQLQEDSCDTSILIVPHHIKSTKSNNLKKLFHLIMLIMK